GPPGRSGGATPHASSMTCPCPPCWCRSAPGGEARPVHHVIAPLDDDHVDAAAQLVSEVASALGIDPAGVASAPHLTIASYRGLAPGAAGRAVAAVAATVPPFRVRAHGYGMFVGDSDGDLSLHVMVVRTTPLDRLHARLHAALERTGARMDGLTR